MDEDELTRSRASMDVFWREKTEVEGMRMKGGSKMESWEAPSARVCRLD